jgi:hypothetical protein
MRLSTLLISLGALLTTSVTATPAPLEPPLAYPELVSDDLAASLSLTARASMTADDGALSGDLPENVAKVWAVRNFHVQTVYVRHTLSSLYHTFSLPTAAATSTTGHRICGLCCPIWIGAFRSRTWARYMHGRRITRGRGESFLLLSFFLFYCLPKY